MNHNFIVTGFADEMDSCLDIQLENLNRLGMKYFEPRGIDGKNISTLTLEEAKVLKEKMDKAGISASSVGSPIGKIQITEPMEPHLELLSHIIKIAKILDTKYIRIFSFYFPEGDTREDWRDEVMRRMRLMADMAEREGVILLHENEEKIYGEGPEHCLDILETVNSPALSCVFDPANYVLCGYKAYPDAYNILKDKIAYFHIKDATFKNTIVPAGEGDGGIPEILADIKKTGKTYFVSLEPHLGSFAGLGQLEAGDRLKDLPEGGPQTFGIAHAALVNILNNLK